MGHRIAIIGFGPRGLGALEAMVSRSASSNIPVSIDIFDPEKWPGAGPNFSPDEAGTCLLNLPLRSIAIQDAPQQAFGSFSDWLGKDAATGDTYLPRAKLGAYLTQRYARLMDRLPANLSVELHDQKIMAANRHGSEWHLTGASEEFGPYDHVLLSLGQPQTRDDEQMARWRGHAQDSEGTISLAYPGAKLIEAAKDWHGRVVAIRGFGLSALDVMRMLTIGLGGHFDDDRYVPSGREPALIVPFSLDGHAPAPKPAHTDLDASFDPQPEENKAFKAALKKALAGPSRDALTTLTDVLIGPTRRILTETGARCDDTEITQWLEAEIEQAGSQEKRGTVEAIRANIAQALGHASPTPGYVFGQLWRKWQPLLREVYNQASKSAETAKAIVGFDEGLKRYSYGAPAEVLEQLVCLIEAGIVNPRAADDPDIQLVDEGWEIQSDETVVRAHVMVDSVLPSPVLGQISEPLINGLVSAYGLAPVGEKLGVDVAANGAVRDANGSAIPGLWLVGRLANGSTVANDSIHDCFSPGLHEWARAVLATKR